MSKKRLRVDANIFSIAKLAMFYVYPPPPPFPPSPKYYVKSWINACFNAVCWRALFRQCVNVYKWSPEHNSISRQKCQHIYPTYIGIKPGISHIFVAQIIGALNSSQSIRFLNVYHYELNRILLKHDFDSPVLQKHSCMNWFICMTLL